MYDLNSNNIGGKANEASNNDNALLNLASYEVSKGMTCPIEDINKVMNTFAYFKTHLKKGSWKNIGELADFVFGRYGYFEKKSYSMSSILNNPETIKHVSKIVEELEEIEKKVRKNNNESGQAKEK